MVRISPKHGASEPHRRSPSYLAARISQSAARRDHRIVRRRPDDVLQLDAEPGDRGDGSGGITIAFSSPPLPGVWVPNVAQSRRIVRIYNDGAAELAREYPARFGLFAALALPDIEG